MKYSHLSWVERTLRKINSGFVMSTPFAYLRHCIFENVGEKRKQRISDLYSKNDKWLEYIDGNI